MGIESLREAEAKLDGRPLRSLSNKKAARAGGLVSIRKRFA
jgi:hypothetical protein